MNHFCPTWSHPRVLGIFAFAHSCLPNLNRDTNFKTHFGLLIVYGPCKR